MQNKEQVYDDQIYPLMINLLEICQANKIAMLASFSIPTEEQPDLMCTSALLGEGYNPPEQLTDALHRIRPSAPPPLMMRTENGDGSVTFTAFI